MRERRSIKKIMNQKLVNFACFLLEYSEMTDRQKQLFWRKRRKKFYASLAKYISLGIVFLLVICITFLLILYVWQDVEWGYNHEAAFNAVKEFFFYLIGQ